jgi:hypothetical protein
MSAERGRAILRGDLTASGGPVRALRPLGGVITARRIGGDAGTTRPGGKPYTATAGSDGSFSLSLPPGVYRVTGRSPDYQDGKRDCITRHLVHVAERDHTKLDVVCLEKATD